MNHLRTFVFLCLFMGIGACAPMNVKLVQNPTTGDVRECKRDPWKNWSWEEEAVIQKCVEEYRKLGYIEAGNHSIKPEKTSPQKVSNHSLVDKLKELKSAYEQGLITETEYNERRNTLLNEF